MRPLSFSLDSSLGKLARWLRLLGHDAAWRRNDDLGRALSRARAEGRVLLTRSADLERLGLSSPPSGSYLIASSALDDQLAELARSMPIFREARPFSRCSDCNLELEEADRESVLKKIPPFVAGTQTKFRTCPGCGKVFWRATHSEKILDRFRRVAKRAGQAFGCGTENRDGAG